MSAGKDETGLQIRMWAAAGAGASTPFPSLLSRQARPWNKSTCRRGHGTSPRVGTCPQATEWSFKLSSALRVISNA